MSVTLWQLKPDSFVLRASSHALLIWNMDFLQNLPRCSYILHMYVYKQHRNEVTWKCEAFQDHLVFVLGHVLFVQWERHFPSIALLCLELNASIVLCCCRKKLRRNSKKNTSKKWESWGKWTLHSKNSSILVSNPVFPWYLFECWVTSTVWCTRL